MAGKKESPMATLEEETAAAITGVKRASNAKSGSLLPTATLKTDPSTPPSINWSKGYRLIAIDDSEIPSPCR